MSRRRPQGPLQAAFAFFASFGLSCVLLLFLFLLTYLGTLAQVEVGLHEAQKRYFESWFLVHQLGPVPLPLPGGQLCMWLLALNLVCGGFIRIRKTSATAGILVTHVGIVMLLLAAVVKLEASEDGYLRLYEGQSGDVFVDYVHSELAIWDASERVDVLETLVKYEDLVACAGPEGRTFRNDALPFELTVSHYLRNADPLPKGPNWSASTPVVDGYALREREPETEASANTAGVYVAARDKETGERSEALLHVLQVAPWTFESGGRTWAIDLRRARYPMPFSVRLEKFYKVDHPGMSMAREYKSDVVKITADGDEQPVLIEMNEPLRAEGLVLYQADYGPKTERGETGPPYSVFAVKRDPSDQWPLYACIVITLGMGWAFIDKLLKHIRASRLRQSRAAAVTAAAAPEKVVEREPALLKEA